MASIPEDPRGEPGYQEFEDAEIGDYYVTRRLGRLPELAADCLRKLGKAGLHAKWRSKDDYMRRVRLKESGETFWLRFGRSVDHWRVPSVEVMRERQQQDAAILAALTLSEVGTTDIKRLDGEVLPRVKELIRSGACTSVKEALARMPIACPGPEGSNEANQLLN